MMIGHRQWAIAEGYIPGSGIQGDAALVSHETACMLNAQDGPAEVELTLFFTDREPAGPYRINIPPRRTMHLRFNDLRDPEPVPRDTDFSCVIRSTVPIVVQHTRLDSRHPNVTLMTTTAFGC